MSEFSQTFTTKIGPAPAWVWGAGAAATFYAWRAWKAHKAGPVAVTAEEQAAADLQAAATVAPTDGYTPGSVGGWSPAVTNAGGVPYVDQSQPTVSGTSSITDNASWKQQMIERLVGRFGYDPCERFRGG